MARARAVVAKQENLEDVKLLIRPQVGMYGAFSRLNYKAWYAIAEFVDNALQSFITNRAKIARADGKKARLRIDIEVAPDRITISDNAAGIARADIERAFTPAEEPPDSSGLSEFGLGMKAASCWFANRWQVRTKALGEKLERTVRFHVKEIIAKGIEELHPSVRLVGDANLHYTSILLEDLNVRPQTRTITKIQSHLASMYRQFLQNGDIEIRFNQSPLRYEEPELLFVPPFQSSRGNAVLWKKPIEIEIDKHHRITGWAGLRETGSVSEAGFAVFRRNRLIQGSFDDTYRPEQIFGKPNSFEYQRLCGELHVEGFKVSHTKDGLHWEEWEELIIDELGKQLNEPPLPLIDQARGHRQGRSRSSAGSWGRQTAKTVVSVIGQHAPPVLGAQIASPPDTTNPKPRLPPAKLTASESAEFEVKHRQRIWIVKVEIADDPQADDWFSYSRGDGGKKRDELTIRINLAHPFSERFGLSREQDLDPLVRVAAGFALAEITALMSGAHASCRAIRRNFNQLLRDALSK